MSKRSEIRKLNKKLEKGELNELLVEKDISKLSKADREQWKKDKEKLLSWGYMVREKSGRRTTTHFSPDKKTTEFEMPRFAKQMLSSAAKAPVKLTFRGIRSAGQKVNPLNKQINKNDVADTGVESLRLANSTVKKTTSAVKTTKSAVRTTKSVATTTVKAAKTTVKATQYTFKFVYEVAAQAVAIVINPLFLFIAGIVLILMMLLGAFMLLIGGQNNSEEAMTTAEGLVEVADQYNKAKDFYNKALSDRKQDFTGIVDKMYFNKDDPGHCHLVYFERVKPPHAVLPKCFANDENKNKIKDQWNYQIDEKEMIAIVYVYLEKQANTQNNTYLQIYEVEYNQDVFTDLIQKSVPLSYIITDNQECPNHDCVHDPDLDNKRKDYEHRANETYASYDPYWDCYRGERSVDEWWDRFGWLFSKYPYFDNEGDDYCDYITETYNHYRAMENEYREKYENSSICLHQHRLHNIGIGFLSKDELMDLLGFDETYKYWVELTVEGFNNNPDIP